MGSQPQNNCIVLDGELDLSRKGELMALFSTLLMDRPATIDLRGVTYADSTVLNILASLNLKFQATPIMLLNPQPQVLRILKMVRFDALFQIANSER